MRRLVGLTLTALLCVTAAAFATPRTTTDRTIQELVVRDPFAD